MKILGISPDVWISSAALLEDGKIIAACAEERFDREKMSKSFPARSIDFCLRERGISIEGVDYVVMSWNPAIHIKSASLRYSKLVRWRGEFLYSIPNYLLSQNSFPAAEYVEEKFHFKGRKLSILFINHHDAHAANAFLLSPFNEAAILTIDGRGEAETCMFAKGSGNLIKKIKSISMPHSLGLFYGALTEYLGFKPHSDEWKVMALASYGKRNNKYYKKLKGLVGLKPDGTFELDLSYFIYYLFDRQPTLYSEKLIQLLGPSRIDVKKIEDSHIQIAQATQQIYEEAATHLLKHLYLVTKRRNLVLSGGCAMNCVFNAKIPEVSPFKNVFISSCPDDTGSSVGAALYVYNCILGFKKRYPQAHNYWGPEYSDGEIKEVIEKYKLRYRRYEDIERQAAKLISEGKLIGWFQGRMEFGQRALGNRSILADPRNISSKELVNRAVKYREGFRPFAPSVLEERAREYFEIPSGITVPFMEKVYKIKPDKRRLIPAVVHVDGTGRLQTVSKSVNPRFYGLIEEFGKITGVALVLNTSFNLNGEPIVATPTDAIRTFISCGLDCLVMGNYLISKENVPQ